MKIQESELILNKDGSVYHLHLLPEQLANTIITVGDPDRVSSVSKYFDSIEVKIQNRELVTHTGMLKGKRISCISTGMGTDNIDIVMNELDALVNIDLEKREAKDNLTSLNIIRIGTSGSLQKEIPIDSFLISSHGMGLDGLIHFYANSENKREIDIEKAFLQQILWNENKPKPYCIKASETLFNLINSDKTFSGITATASGFYGPQGRILRLQPESTNINDELGNFNFKDLKITNFEMETAGIYGMAKLLGHNALSCNCIIANRPLGQFSKNPSQKVAELIEYVLEKVSG